MAETLGNMEWRRGDSYPFTIFVKSKATETVPAALIDITGYSFIFTVHSVKDPTSDTTKIFDTTGVVAADQDANKGEVTFTPLVADTETFTGDGKFFFDIESTDPSGNIRTITPVGIKFTMSQDLTKPTP